MVSCPPRGKWGLGNRMGPPTSQVAQGRIECAFRCALQKRDDLMRFESVLSLAHSSAV